MDQQKYILGFDTAMGACTVGLYDMAQEACITKTCEEMNRGQAERLIPMIDETLKQAGIDYPELAAVGCTRGPGAFTGLRLSLATAKALSYSLNIPALGITTLDAIARTRKSIDHSSTLPVFVCLETKRKDYYIQTFTSSLEAMDFPQSATTREIANILNNQNEWLLCGDAVDRLMKDNIDTDNIYQTLFILAPSAESLCESFYREYKSNRDLKEISPLYLRAPDVSLSKK